MESGKDTVKAPVGIYAILAIKSLVLVLAHFEGAGFQALMLLKLLALISCVSSGVTIYLFRNKHKSVKATSIIPFASLILLLLAIAIIDFSDVPSGLLILAGIVITSLGFWAVSRVYKFIDQDYLKDYATSQPHT